MRSAVTNGSNTKVRKYVLTFEVTVTGLDQDTRGVTATLTGEDRVSTARFDLVIAADGLRSRTRGLILRADEVDTFDTGWGGWVAWADPGPGESGTYTETWGRGFFIGRYPVPGRVGIFIGAPYADTAAGPAGFTGRLRGRLRNGNPVTARSLEAIEHAHDPYLWRFTDTRAQRWATGRVVLLGDAAAGFLPTAGIGATIAMESAAVLAAHLSKAAPEEIGDRLHEYERVQRPRVIAAHENSRQLAKLMFRKGRIVCTTRDITIRFATMNMALRPIIKLHHNPTPPTR